MGATDGITVPACWKEKKNLQIFKSTATDLPNAFLTFIHLFHGPSMLADK